MATFTPPAVCNKALLLDPTAELFRMSVRMAEHAQNLRQAAVGRDVACGADFRGTVAAVSARDATLKGPEGTTVVPLTPKRVAALLAAGAKPAPSAKPPAK